ncbi:hypothetical protein FM107_05960 [Sphingobacterium sp. JB170]|nr:hypothetical protein FM107_05960 [Sphingobacterium sp. JB170]
MNLSVPLTFVKNGVTYLVAASQDISVYIGKQKYFILARLGFFYI